MAPILPAIAGAVALGAAALLRQRRKAKKAKPAASRAASAKQARRPAPRGGKSSPTARGRKASKSR